MPASIHRRHLRRFEIDGHARFVTFSCYRRLPLLNNDQIRRLFLDRLRHVVADQQILLLAWVLMPEHVHLIVFPQSTPDLRSFTHALKRPVAEAVLRRWKQLESPILNRLRHGNGYRFWQTGGGYDHNLFNPAAVLEKIEYLHNNPVRRQLSSNALEYRWSSARAYVKFSVAEMVCDPLPW